MDEIRTDIAKFIREKREQRGLSIEDLSQRSGFSAEVLRNLESAQIAPPMRTITDLLRVLEVPGLEAMEFLGRIDRKIFTKKLRV